VAEIALTAIRKRMERVGRATWPVKPRGWRSNAAGAAEIQRYHRFWSIFFPLHVIFYVTIVLLKLGLGGIETAALD
jgi:hypothetical protein